jgi:hypothetical protein
VKQSVVGPEVVDFGRKILFALGIEKRLAGFVERQR